MNLRHAILNHALATLCGAVLAGSLMFLVMMAFYDLQLGWPVILWAVIIGGIAGSCVPPLK
jgi:hypothetical protein